MPISQSDLFQYELSGICDAEKKAAALKDEIVGQLRGGDLQQIIRAAQQEGQQRINNLKACFQALGTRRGDVACPTVDGVRAEFQQFTSQRPDPDTLDAYVIGTLLKLSNLGTGWYSTLVDKAVAVGQSRCAQLLQSNLVLKREETARLERLSHDLNQRVMATA